jgi:hypothetical protein
VLTACGIVNLSRCFQQVVRWWHVSLVVPFPLLLLGSWFRLMLAQQACPFELLLYIALHVSQRDLEVVKPEVGTCRFLLSSFARCRVSALIAADLASLFIDLSHFLCEINRRQYLSAHVVRAVMDRTQVFRAYVAFDDALSAPCLSWG